MDWLEYDETIELYKKALAENVDNDLIRPPKHKVHVQSMPQLNRWGSIWLPSEKKDFVDDLEQIMCGTVLSVGEGTPDELKPGVDVMFEKKFGIVYAGMYNPLKVGKDTDWEDKIRIFTISPTLQEIFGVVDYEHVGETLYIRPPGEGDPYEVEVVDESIIYGGSMRVRLEDGTERWASYEWIVDKPKWSGMIDLEGA